jgi:dolichol-phosphate mannosyltransferase
MVAFASDGVVSFSAVPLRVTLTLGFVVSGLSFLMGIFAVFAKLFEFYTVPGWASVVVAVGFLGGVQLMVMGVMGEYIARIHDEVKQRPLYLIRDSSDVEGADRSASPLPRRTAVP